MSFEEASVADIDQLVCRLQAPLGFEDALSALGVSPRNTSAVERFLNSTSTRVLSVTEVLIAFDPGKPPTASRFTDGNYPVLYTAIERQTAIDEIQHHVLKRLRATVPADAYYEIVSYRVKGAGKDFRPMRARMPFLSSADDVIAYPLCQAIGRKAKEYPLALILTPSARNQGGGCVPVFESAAIDAQSARLEGVVAFSYDKSTDQARFRDIA